jgi:hypothetical protein
VLYRIAPDASTPGSSSPDKTKPATTTTAKPVTSIPDTSPTKAWNAPLAQAKANSPQQSVTVKPGDSLWSIGTSRSDMLPSVEGVNHDLYGLGYNLIHPGQTVDLPKNPARGGDRREHFADQAGHHDDSLCQHGRSGCGIRPAGRREDPAVGARRKRVSYIAGPRGAALRTITPRIHIRAAPPTPGGSFHDQRARSHGRPSSGSRTSVSIGRSVTRPAWAIVCLVLRSPPFP